MTGIVFSDRVNVNCLDHENSMKKQTAGWADIKWYADTVLDIRGFSADMEWAKRAWALLEKTPLTQYATTQEFYQVLVRLFCLGEIVGTFNYCRMDEPFEPYERYAEWVDECELTKIRLIVLAGEDYYEDSYLEDWDGISEIVDVLIDREYDVVLEWLKVGFGGKNGLLRALVGPVADDDEESDPLMSEKLEEWAAGGFARQVF